MASRLRRFATGLTIDRTLALVLLTLLLGWAVSRPIGDPDLGWHLKAGEWIWRHGALPRSDPFGYPTAGVGWLPYSWLAEIVFWGVTAGAGAHVLIIGCGLLFAGTFAIVYQTSRGQGAAPAVAAAVTLLAALSALPYFAQRPVAFSFLALAICGRTLWRSTRGTPVSAFGHGVLFALWANIHVFFIVGLLWLWAAPFAAARAHRRWRKYVPVALAATLGTFCTPFGLALHRELLALTGEPILLTQIVEFMSPDFHTLGGGLILAFLLTLVASLVAARERPPAILLAAILGHTALALYMQRNAPMLMILATPAIAHALTQAWSIALPPRPATVPPATLLAVRAAVVFASLLLLWRVLPTDPSLEAHLDRAAFPIDATHFVQSQPPLGRMFNSFGWGGYLVQELYPDYQVSIDGRTTTYGRRNSAYLKTAFVQEGWQGYLDTLAPDFILWPRHEPFVQMIASHPREWSRVYADRVAVIYVRAAHPLRRALRTAGRQYAHAAPTLLARPR